MARGAKYLRGEGGKYILLTSPFSRVLSKYREKTSYKSVIEIVLYIFVICAVMLTWVDHKVYLYYNNSEE